MASTAPSPLLPSPTPPRCVPRAIGRISPPPKALHGRREWLLLLTASTASAGIAVPASAADIPLFGLRKKVETLEEAAVEIIKEGEKAVEKEIETAEKEVAAAETEVEKAIAASQVAQAGAVAVAEAAAVLIATSIVNAILGPEARKT